jgi:hypothetical protein
MRHCIHCRGAIRIDQAATSGFAYTGDAARTRIAHDVGIANRAGTITVQVAASIVRHVTNGAEAHSLEESRSESLTTKASKNGLEQPPLPESNSSQARNFALRLDRPDSDGC